MRRARSCARQQRQRGSAHEKADLHEERTDERGSERFFIADIGMRFLTVRELYAAQGFPSDYKFEFDVNGKPYSKKDAIARCGNSVSPIIAQVLVRANVKELTYKTTINSMKQLEELIA